MEKIDSGRGIRTMQWVADDCLLLAANFSTSLCQCHEETLIWFVALS